MDSMVNRYTANRRMRSEDALSPDSRHDMRPDYPSIVYTQILKKLFPDVPVALGGTEASLRRISHYDYWKDELRKCILCDSGADLILYGMGERSIVELANAFAEGKTLDQIHEMPQVVFYCKENEIPGGFQAVTSSSTVTRSVSITRRDRLRTCTIWRKKPTRCMLSA